MELNIIIFERNIIIIKKSLKLNTIKVENSSKTQP
jgi:hypothetical protein